MLDKIKDKLVKNERAFTLIEALITLALFSVVVLIATNIYMSVISIQTRVVSLQKIQEDVRFLMESVTQSVRLGYINYNFYKDPNSDQDYADAINLLNSVDKLAVIDQMGNYIFYRYIIVGQDKKIQFCTGTLTDCNLTTGTGWQDITPKGVQVTDLKFIITPSADPFTSPTPPPLSCIGSCGGQYLSYKCVSNVCQYYSDNYKFQPKVKIILKTESPGERIAEKASIHLQTIVSTRIPNFEVKNLNYDL